MQRGISRHLLVSHTAIFLEPYGTPTGQPEGKNARAAGASNTHGPLTTNS